MGCDCAVYALIAAIGAIALVVDDLITYINGGESALSGLWAMFGTGDEIGARFKAIWKASRPSSVGVWDALSGVAKLFNSILTLDGKALSKPQSDLGGISKINDVLVEMLNWVAQKLYNLLPDWIKDWLGGDESSRPEETKAEAAPGALPIRCGLVMSARLFCHRRCAPGMRVREA